MSFDITQNPLQRLFEMARVAVEKVQQTEESIRSRASVRVRPPDMALLSSLAPDIVSFAGEGTVYEEMSRAWVQMRAALIRGESIGNVWPTFLSMAAGRLSNPMISEHLSAMQMGDKTTQQEIDQASNHHYEDVFLEILQLLGEEGIPAQVFYQEFIQLECDLQQFSIANPHSKEEALESIVARNILVLGYLEEILTASPQETRSLSFRKAPNTVPALLGNLQALAQSAKDSPYPTMSIPSDTHKLSNMLGQVKCVKERSKQYLYPTFIKTVNDGKISYQLLEDLKNLGILNEREFNVLNFLREKKMKNQTEAYDIVINTLQLGRSVLINVFTDGAAKSLICVALGEQYKDKFKVVPNGPSGEGNALIEERLINPLPELGVRVVANERDSLVYFYGLFGVEPLKLRDVAEKIGLDYTVVSYYINRGLVQLGLVAVQA